jgi:hypothetical protein
MIDDNIPSWHDLQPIRRTRAGVFREWLFVTVGVLDFALVVYSFGIGAAFKYLSIGALAWAWLVTWAGLVNKGAKQTHQDVATFIVLIGAALFLGIVLGNLLSPTATKRVPASARNH